MTVNEHPKAIATLSADGVHWIVPHCPICGREHYHGAGGPGANHAEYLGHRVAHCAGQHAGTHGYVLVQAPKGTDQWALLYGRAKP